MLTADKTLELLKEAIEYIGEQPEKTAFLHGIIDFINSDEVMYNDAHQTYLTLIALSDFHQYELKNAKEAQATPEHIAFLNWKVTSLQSILNFTKKQLIANGIEPQ